MTGKHYQHGSSGDDTAAVKENTKTNGWDRIDRLGCKRTDPRSWSPNFLNQYLMTADRVGGWIIEGSMDGHHPMLGDFVRQMFWHYDEKIDADKLRELCLELDDRWNDLIISDNERDLPL